MLVIKLLSAITSITNRFITHPSQQPSIPSDRSLLHGMSLSATRPIWVVCATCHGESGESTQLARQAVNQLGIIQIRSAGAGHEVPRIIVIAYSCMYICTRCMYRDYSVVMFM